MEIVILFFTGFMVDVTWGLYLKYFNCHKYFFAALVSVGTGICSLTMVHNTDTLILKVSWLLGLFFGTFIFKYWKIK